MAGINRGEAGITAQAAEQGFTITVDKQRAPSGVSIRLS